MRRLSKFVYPMSRFTEVLVLFSPLHRNSVLHPMPRFSEFLVLFSLLHRNWRVSPSAKIRLVILWFSSLNLNSESHRIPTFSEFLLWVFPPSVCQSNVQQAVALIFTLSPKYEDRRYVMLITCTFERACYTVCVLSLELGNSRKKICLCSCKLSIVNCACVCGVYAQLQRKRNIALCLFIHRQLLNVFSQCFFSLTGLWRSWTCSSTSSSTSGWR